MMVFGKILKLRNMKKSVFVFFAASLCLAACQIEVVEPNAYDTSDNVLSAQIEQNEVTKTVLGESNNVLWSENDQIVAFIKSSYGHKYQIKPSFAGKTYADFSRVSSASGDDLSAGIEWDHNVAFYPYSESIKCVKSGDNYTLEVVLPAEQTYEENSFGNGFFPMVAVSEDSNITFKNVCGGIKLQLKGTQIVNSITIQGKNNEKLSGAATVTAYTDETKPAIAMAQDASTTVTLNCGDGVWLNENEPTEFIISLPPVVFTKGFSVNVVFDKNNIQVIQSDKENEVLRSSLLVMPEVTIEAPANPEGTTIDLSEDGTANCYIVSNAGAYKFTPTKGNSSESVGSIASAVVLWETFGTAVTPNVGDLVKNVKYENGVISFETPSAYKEGNAVIAAKDANGTILWSWHIWLTDQPEGQVYYNNAGTMMDRNLGATSATPGDVGALGLLYQWGRKDPFLSSSSIHYYSMAKAKSTITWPSAVSSNSSNGTIAYATANPTTFITYNDSNYDWYYTGSLSTDNTRWTTSDSTKSIYDPCPAGWRVPDGGDNGVWSKALGSSNYISDYPYDSTNEGMNFSGKFGADQTIWYPASGYRISDYGGSLSNVGECGFYWSAFPNSKFAYFLYFTYMGSVYPSNYGIRAHGQSVRCLQE